MGVKETILDLLARLASIPVTDQDTNSVSMYSALWNNQIERKKEGTGYVYRTPASFLEMQFSEGMPIGLGATSYEVKFVIMLEHHHYNTEGSLDQDLIIFDLIDKVHRYLNGYKPANCSPLYKSGKTLDYNHDNTYLATLEYSSHFIDLTGSAHDDLTGAYLIESLTNPRLVIEETVYYGAYPLSGTGDVFTMTGDIVASSSLNGNSWHTGVGVPSTSIGRNGDYYRNESNGAIYYRWANSWSLVGSIAGGGGSGGGGITLYSLEGDANFTLTDATAHLVNSNTLTQDRTIDVSLLTTEAEVHNGDQLFMWNFTGGTVYADGGVNVVTEAPAYRTTRFRKVGSKIIVT